MYILVVGLNYKTAPVQVRENLAFNVSQFGEAMKALQNKKGIIENVILSTCNRTEIYVVVDEIESGKYEIIEFLSEWFQIEKEIFSPHLFFYVQELAIEHLFKVTCGLNSMMLGETQILGQVRTSFLLAQKEKTIGNVFNHSFKRAVTLGKRAQSETEIGLKAVSVSYAAVELAKKIFTSLNEKKVLLLGAGKMSELAYRNLKGNGTSQVTVINRTFEKAKDLASRFTGEAKEFGELQSTLADTDIIISSTSAKEFVITKEMIVKASAFREGKPLLIIDIAVPRDLDPNIEGLENVFLYNIDDLRDIVSSNLQERIKAAEEIMTMIDEEPDEFKQWVNLLDVIPIITALNTKAATIHKQITESIKQKLPNLSEREIQVIHKHTKSIINQLLKDPLIKIKEMASSIESDRELEVLIKIFDIENLVKENNRLLDIKK